MMTNGSAIGWDEDEHIDADPMQRFARWLPAAYTEGTNFALMTLSTVDLLGYPEGRTVLLSEFDADGFCFHTDETSNKVAQLRAQPRAALTLVWPEFARQVLIQGDVVQLETSEAARAYLARSPYLRLLALLNTPANAQLPLLARKALYAEGEAAAVGHDPRVEAPPSWVGFRVRPLRIVFWQGSTEASSQRVEYRKLAAGWATAKLPG